MSEHKAIQKWVKDRLATCKGTKPTPTKFVWAWVLEFVWDKTTPEIKRMVMELAKADVCSVATDGCEVFRGRFQKKKDRLDHRTVQLKRTLSWHDNSCMRALNKINSAIARARSRYREARGKGMRSLKAWQKAKKKIRDTRKSLRNGWANFKSNQKVSFKCVRMHTKEICGLTRVLNDMR